MFKKRNRNFRRRNVSEEDERTDEANTNTVPVESANEVAGEPPERKEKVEIKQTFVVTVANEDIVKSGPGKGQGVGVGVVGGGGGGCGGKGDVEDGGENQEKKKGPRSAASLLSFCDEEDEGEVIHVKKPTLSRKLAKKLKQEYLQESQRYTQDKGPNKEGNAEDCVEGSAVSQHGVQPSLGPTILGKEVEMEVDNDSGEDGREISQKMRSEAPLRPFSFLSSLKPGEIPDARFIHEARKRRQLAREQGGVAYGPAPSFIPLESGGSTARRTGNNPALQSRLVRDSDGDDDEDEDEGASRGKDLTGDGGESGCDGVCGGRRIAMRGLRTRTQRQAIAEEIGIEDSDDERLDLEHGQDDDVRTWEQGQLQKAIGLVSVQQAAAPHDGGPFHEVYRGTLPQPFAPIGPVYPQAVMLPSQHQTLSAEPPSLGQLTKSLQNKLVALQEQRARHRIELEGVRTDLESCRKMINQLGASSLEAASRYSFHQELVGYIRDLSECLNEKVPTVNELDSALLDVLAGRAARLARRRREDVTDEASQCTPPLSRQGKTDGMSRNQNMDAAMQRRVAEREARRTRRRQAREGVEITNSPYATHHEGLSSDDEETSIDVATFTAEKERILEEATSIWIDVWEEFGTVSGISIRFASWHKSFPAAYQQAFAALCLSRLLTPLLQIQLLRWNPLEPNCPDLESFPWFESLLFYGCDDIGSSITKEEKVDGIAAGNGPPTDDPDLEIIPSLVEKVVIPRLNNLVRTVWDPMSTSQTERLVRTVTLIIKNYPTATLAVSKPSKALLKSILLRLRQAVDEDVFIPIYHKIVMEKGSAQARFALRKFWSAVKLMRSVAAWHGLLNATSLRELSLDGILNRYLLLSLQAAPPSSGLMQAQQIVSILPRAWCEWDAEGGQSPPQLANLCRYIYHAATSIHRLAFGCPDTERRQARETVQQACQLLRSMGATDHATALTAECNPTPSTQSQAANTPSPATSILNPAAGPQHM